MIRKVVILCFVLLFFIIPNAMANDGGAFPDYNEYVTYTVETDCKEIAIGETITFTMTFTNHTKAPFGYFRFNEIFHDTRYDEDGAAAELEYGEWSLEPNSTSHSTLTYVVPEYVGWYKKGDDFYIDLCPMIYYSFPPGEWGEWEKYDLPYDIFDNMIGVEPIPIKLTNVIDGSSLVEFNLIDSNKHFMYSDRYPEEFTGFTYAGEYLGGIKNYLSIVNRSSFSYDVIYIDGYKWEFFRKEVPLILDSKMDIIIKTETMEVRLPEDVPEYEDVTYNMLFADESGNYYGVTVQRKCETSVFEMPPIDIVAERLDNNEDGDPVFDITVHNTSNEDIEDFFIYYGEKFPQTEAELYSKVVREDLNGRSALKLPESVVIKYRVDYIGEAYSLRIGYWIDDSLCYWKLFIPVREQNSVCRYTNDDYAYGIYTEVFDLTNDINVFDINGALKQASIAVTTDIPKPTSTLTPTNIPMPTAEIKVLEIEKHIIPSWVYIIFSISAIVTLVLIICGKGKHKKGKKV